jgi:hypothetical protein
LGAGRSSIALAIAERGAGFDAGSLPSGLWRGFGAGSSARPKSAAGGGAAGFCGAIVGIDGTFGGGIFGSGGFGIDGIAVAVFTGNATRDLQLLQFTNFAPAGTSASAMRLRVPHAEQVASIIRRKL